MSRYAKEKEGRKVGGGGGGGESKEGGREERGS